MNHIIDDLDIFGSSGFLLGKVGRNWVVDEVDPSMYGYFADLYLAPLYFYRFVEIYDLNLLMVIMSGSPQYFCSC